MDNPTPTPTVKRNIVFKIKKKKTSPPIQVHGNTNDEKDLSRKLVIPKQLKIKLPVQKKFILRERKSPDGCVYKFKIKKNPLTNPKPQLNPQNPQPNPQLKPKPQLKSQIKKTKFSVASCKIQCDMDLFKAVFQIDLCGNIYWLMMDSGKVEMALQDEFDPDVITVERWKKIVDFMASQTKIQRNRDKRNEYSFNFLGNEYYENVFVNSMIKLFQKLNPGIFNECYLVCRPYFKKINDAQTLNVMIIDLSQMDKETKHRVKKNSGIKQLQQPVLFVDIPGEIVLWNCNGEQNLKFTSTFIRKIIEHEEEKSRKKSFLEFPLTFTHELQKVQIVC